MRDFKDFKKWMSQYETSTVHDMWITLENMCKNDEPIGYTLAIFADAIKDAGGDWDFSNKIQWLGQIGRKQPSKNMLNRYVYYLKPEYMFSAKDDNYLPQQVFDKLMSIKNHFPKVQSNMLYIQFETFKDAILALASVAPW